MFSQNSGDTDRKTTKKPKKVYHTNKPET